MSTGGTDPFVLTEPDNRLLSVSLAKSVIYDQPGPDTVLSSKHRGRISVDRCVLTSSELQLDEGPLGIEPPLAYHVRQSFVHSCQSKVVFARCSYFARSAFPCVDTLRNYKWRTDLLSDLSAGLTVGVMNVPQGKFDTEYSACSFRRRTVKLSSLIMPMSLLVSLCLLYCFKAI